MTHDEREVREIVYPPTKSDGARMISFRRSEMRCTGVNAIDEEITLDDNDATGATIAGLGMDLGLAENAKRDFGLSFARSSDNLISSSFNCYTWVSAMSSLCQD